MLCALLLPCCTSRVVPTRILAFGDSLTAGLVAGTRDCYSPYGATLSQLTGAEVVSRGVVMESAHAMPARLASVLESESSFDCAIVLGGSNDLWTGDADAIWASLQQPAAPRGLDRLGLGSATIEQL